MRDALKLAMVGIGLGIAGAASGAPAWDESMFSPSASPAPAAPPPAVSKTRQSVDWLEQTLLSEDYREDQAAMQRRARASYAPDQVPGSAARSARAAAAQP